MDCLITTATLEDAADMSAFMQPVVKKFVTFEFTEQAENIMLDTMTEDALKDKISSDYLYLIARDSDSGEPLGVLGMKGDSHLFHLFVSEKAQGQGIGKNLWLHLLERTEVRSFTVNSSRLAVGFYENLGFKRQGELFEKNGVRCYPMIFETTETSN